MTGPPLSWSQAALIVGLGMIQCTPSAAYAATEKVLYSFAGTIGSDPQAVLAIDDAGNLYGTTLTGGLYHAGNIFKLAADGNASVLYSFTGGTDGATPFGGMIYDEPTATLYGTTTYGGANGDGVVFKLTADGAETILHTFNGKDGAKPASRLIRDAGGSFYGTATEGGTNHCDHAGCGTIFKLSPDGTYTVLYNFTGGADGYSPEARLKMDRDGNLIGAAEDGGDPNCKCGTIYKLGSDGRFSVLYTFTGGTDGAYPYGGLTRDSQGNLYGTSLGVPPDYNGTVFRLAPDGTYTTLHAFNASDGKQPFGDLRRIGKNHRLFGTTEYGGAKGFGTVFEIQPDGKFKLLYSFGGRRDGAYPFAGLIYKRGKLYGTTVAGGSHSQGTVFSITRQ